MNNNLLLICAAFLLYFGFSDIKHFNILYDGFAIAMGAFAIVIFFINRNKQ